MIYFWSDLHFFHGNIIKYCKRPFWYDDAGSDPKPDIEAMNDKLIQSWNEHVRPNDTMYYLGDFSFSHDYEKVRAVFDQLNGDKILIKGNHDYKEILNLGWTSIHDYLEIKHSKKQFMLFHYPIASWKNKSHGSIHLYGHVHGNSPPMSGRCLDVGYDNGYDRPLSVDEVIEHMNKIPFNGDQF